MPIETYMDPEFMANRFGRRPEECEKITVGTWGSGFDKFHATRNFIMKTTQGND